MKHTNVPIQPPSTVANNILLRASITMTNSYRDKASTYLNPHELLEKPERVPLIYTEKRIKENESW